MTDYVAIPFRSTYSRFKRSTMHLSLAITGFRARARERAVLRNLSDAALKDCGLSRADVAREIRRLRW
jgi:uncharacterized protein YjiS (DUF1127 family)